MHISLRSQTAVITTAVIGATAVGITPSMSAVSQPTLSSTKASVAVAAFDGPLDALIGTGVMGFNYVFKNGYSSDPVTNWGVASRIGETWNDLLPLTYDPVLGHLPHITSVGMIPNFLQDPFPVGAQLLRNWIGYARSGDITTIVNSIVTNWTAFVNTIKMLIPELRAISTYQSSVLSAAVRDAIAGISEALRTGDIKGAWDAGVTGLLSPDGVPGTLLNLTIGAGVQTDRTDPDTFVPSLRTEVQFTAQSLADALRSTTAPSSSAARGAPTAASAAGGQEQPTGRIGRHTAGAKSAVNAISAGTAKKGGDLSPGRRAPEST